MGFAAVCTEDMKVGFTNTAGPPDLVYLGDQGVDLVKVVPTYSQAVRWRDRRIVTERISITWAVLTGGCAFSSATHTFVSGAAMLQTSAIAVSAERKKVLRKGDTATLGCLGSWTAPNGAAVTCMCEVEITDAGQDKVQAK